MKHLILASLLVLPACKAGGGPDYEIIGRELELTAQDLVDLKLIAANDPKLVRIFTDLQAVVETVNLAVSAGEPDSVLDAVSAGLLVTEQLLLSQDISEKDRTYISATIFVVRSVLRRVEAYSE